MGLYETDKAFVCPICNKEIREDELTIDFPDFIASGDSLREFSNGRFHSDCFDNWEQKNVYLEKLDRYNEKRRLTAKKKVVTAEEEKALLDKLKKLI